MDRPCVLPPPLPVAARVLLEIRLLLRGLRRRSDRVVVGRTDRSTDPYQIPSEARPARALDLAEHPVVRRHDPSRATAVEVRRPEPAGESH